MVHYFPENGGMRYGTGSSRLRHNDRGNPSNNAASPKTPKDFDVRDPWVDDEVAVGAGAIRSEGSHPDRFSRHECGPRVEMGRSNPANLIEINGTRIVLDCGMGVSHQLAAAVDLREIHPDQPPSFRS